MELLEGTFMSIMLLFVVTTLHESNELKLQESIFKTEYVFFRFYRQDIIASFDKYAFK